MTRVRSFNPFSTVALGVLCVACTATRPEPEPPPPPEPAPVIADPARHFPDLNIAPPASPPPRIEASDSIVARRFVALGRAIRSDPGDLAKAADLFNRALSLHPDSRDALWELGWTYQLEGHWDEALAAWGRLSAIAPDHPGVRRYIPIIEMRRDAQAARLNNDPLIEIVPRRGDRLTIGAVGDVQMGRGWPEEAQQLPSDSGRGMFEGVSRLLRHPDVTFGNLETVLADSGASTKCRRGSGNCYAFRAPTAFAATLGEVGFDILSTNNNHANDFGDMGLTSTVEALHAADLKSSGSLGSASWESKGLTVAMLAFSTGDGPYRVQDIASAIESVRSADRTHDLVFVSFHGGAEGSGATRVPKQPESAFGEDRGDVYRFARALVDAGADLILGHGPHVLRGMEVYRGRFIAYSLGNFAAWHGFNLRGPSGISAILDVTLAPNGVVTDATIHSVILETPGVPRPDPQNRAVSIIRELSQLDFGTPLFDERGRLLNPPSSSADSTGSDRE